MLSDYYYSLGKTASAKSLLVPTALGAGLGALYGIGDSSTNPYNELLNESSYSRAGQGAVGGLGGGAGYTLARSLGRGRAVSGLIGLLSAAGASSLAAPKLTKSKLQDLPF